MRKLILALDLSIARTGFALFDLETEKNLMVGNIPTKSLKKNNVPKFEREHLKYVYIADTLLDALGEHVDGIQYIIGEDYAYGGSSLSKLAECNGAIGATLAKKSPLDFAKRLTVAVPSVKKFTTGDGRAKKPEMMASVCERWGFCSEIDDESDAYAIGKIGLMVINNTPSDRYEKELRKIVLKRNKKVLGDMK